MLTIAGAELVQVPAVPYKNPNNYVKYSGRLAELLAKVRHMEKTGRSRSHTLVVGAYWQLLLVVMFLAT